MSKYFKCPKTGMNYSEDSYSVCPDCGAIHTKKQRSQRLVDYRECGWEMPNTIDLVKTINI